MKKIVLLGALLVSLQEIAVAKEIPLKEKWVGMLWRESEKPIVMPILADSEKECMDMVTEMNNITKETVKINRNVTCQKVMVK